jgi:predicted nucleic acid-binding Zn ribbon protein
MNETEKTNIVNAFPGLELNYGTAKNGMEIVEGAVGVYYKGVGYICTDSYSAVETFCNEVDGG